MLMSGISVSDKKSFDLNEFKHKLKEIDSSDGTAADSSPEMQRRCLFEEAIDSIDSPEAMVGIFIILCNLPTTIAHDHWNSLFELVKTKIMNLKKIGGKPFNSYRHFDAFILKLAEDNYAFKLTYHLVHEKVKLLKFLKDVPEEDKLRVLKSRGFEKDINNLDTLEDSLKNQDIEIYKYQKDIYTLFYRLCMVIHIAHEKADFALVWEFIEPFEAKKKDFINRAFAIIQSTDALSRIFFHMYHATKNDENKAHLRYILLRKIFVYSGKWPSPDEKINDLINTKVGWGTDTSDLKTVIDASIKEIVGFVIKNFSEKDWSEALGVIYKSGYSILTENEFLCKIIKNCYEHLNLTELQAESSLASLLTESTSDIIRLIDTRLYSGKDEILEGLKCLNTLICLIPEEFLFQGDSYRNIFAAFLKHIALFEVAHDGDLEFYYAAQNKLHLQSDTNIRLLGIKCWQQFYAYHNKLLNKDNVLDLRSIKAESLTLFQTKLLLIFMLNKINGDASKSHYSIKAKDKTIFTAFAKIIYFDKILYISEVTYKSSFFLKLLCKNMKSSKDLIKMILDNADTEYEYALFNCIRNMARATMNTSDFKSFQDYLHGSHSAPTSEAFSTVPSEENKIKSQATPSFFSTKTLEKYESFDYESETVELSSSSASRCNLI